MSNKNSLVYKDVDFASFKVMAKDDNLSKYQKIGFLDEYRKGREKDIFDDILHKLSVLRDEKNIDVLDIGPGCSDLPNYIINLCDQHKNSLFLCDSDEMLVHIEDKECITKITKPFPDSFEPLKQAKPQGFDVIICYSVFQYIAFEYNACDFIDKTISLLKDGGQMLIGDIPNFSKRKRFFSSKNGVKFHQDFTKTTTLPNLEYDLINDRIIDDSLLDFVINRARFNGCDAYLIPQNKLLPMSNRRDDLLIMKP